MRCWQPRLRKGQLAQACPLLSLAALLEAVQARCCFWAWSSGCAAGRSCGDEQPLLLLRKRPPLLRQRKQQL